MISVSQARSRIEKWSFMGRYVNASVVSSMAESVEMEQQRSRVRNQRQHIVGHIGQLPAARIDHCTCALAVKRFALRKELADFV